MTMGGVVGRRRRARLEQGTGVSFPLEWSSLQVLLKLATRGYVRLISAYTDRRTHTHGW